MVFTAAANIARTTDTNKAVALYGQAVALDSVNPAARNFLAFTLAVSRRFAEAHEEYARVIELNPAAPWAHAGLGLSFLLEGKFEEAAATAQNEAGEWGRLLIAAMARWCRNEFQNRTPRSRS